jgi:ferredoxin
MSVTVFYFTGTGNSLAAARTLAGRLKDACIVPLAGIVNAGRPFQLNTDKAVFVFPVYCAGIPAIVANSLDLIKMPRTQYVAAIANCASSAGTALDIFAAEMLRRCGRTLSAGHVIFMPGNYTPLYGSEKPATIERMLKEADNRLLEIACEITAGRPIDYSMPAFLALMTRLPWKLCVSSFPYMQKRFKVESNCTGCGLCARVCPVNNIVMSANARPQWLKKCEQCMACLQYCPVEAIQCLWWTKGRARYRHPGIAASEIAAQKHMPAAEENR